MPNKVIMIGVGWCIITQRECPFSEGHGPDGMVKCSYKGECPEVKNEEGYDERKTSKI